MLEWTTRGDRYCLRCRHVFQSIIGKCPDCGVDGGPCKDSYCEWGCVQRQLDTANVKIENQNRDIETLMRYLKRYESGEWYKCGKCGAQSIVGVSAAKGGA